ncbi:hypothetical protein DFH08DRAFT_825875 [Mycena albidolilacea]|uniref:Uncharacterized protein n=1 Tax=Mycena albidolilacea TaxID=1033008 RepID=A0AAD7E9P4_9AGAR|nr:hypothetical protein DFH08DRAFT_825875 [Mycena albidolilacea]
MDTANDPVHMFFMEAHNICVQAQFVVDSLPNSNLPAVERSTHQLSAVNLDQAHLLHDLGNTYNEIALAMGANRKTLYRQFVEAAIPTARLEFTEISNDALEELVAKISLLHPFVGSVGQNRLFKMVSRATNEDQFNRQGIHVEIGMATCLEFAMTAYFQFQHSIVNANSEGCSEMVIDAGESKAKQHHVV